MAVSISLRPLDDACFFLNQAVALPQIPSSALLRERYLEAVVLFAWIAFEGAVIDAFQLHTRSGAITTALPRKLSQRATLVLSAMKNRPDLDRFKRARKLRNDIVHHGANTPQTLTVDEARMVFDYCRTTIQLFFPWKLVVKG